MGQKNKVRWAIAVLVVGVGYDIYYFAGKRRSHGPSTSSAVASPVEPTIATPKVDVGFYASLLAGEAELHQMPTLITKVARDPFATMEEQQRGMRHDQILASRVVAEPTPAKAGEPVIVVPKDPLAGFVLKAVMVRANRSVALINEALLSRGDTLPDSEWSIESIEQNIVHLRHGDEKRSLRLR